MRGTKDDIVYEETVPSRGIFGTLIAVTLLMGGTTALQALTGPVGDDPAPTAVLAGFTVLFALCAWNFRKIDVRVTTVSVRVAYGVFAAERKLADIASCETAPKPWYFGYGVRFVPYKGRAAWMFNAMRVPNVGLVTREDGPRPLLFASRDPEAVCRAITTALPR